MSEHTVWTLAGMAGCASPETVDSPGAKFLQRVADGFTNEWRDGIAAGEDPHDLAAQMADALVPVYTYDIWRTFTDLGAWEQMAEAWEEGLLEGAPQHSDQPALVALYIIAERLLLALSEEAGDVGEGV